MTIRTAPDTTTRPPGAPVRLVLDDLLTILRDAGWTDHKTNQH